MSSNKVVLIVTEGETDDLFYKKILDVLKNKTLNKKFDVKKIEYFCMKGFCKFESKLEAKFKNFLKNLKKDLGADFDLYVFLCYDDDIFAGKQYPPTKINVKKIEKKLISYKAKKVYHIVASESIEDFILLDFEGILKFLNLKDIKKAKYRGVNGLKNLFRLANKSYIKGAKCEKLLDALDFNIIEKGICNQLCEICNVIGVNCKCKK